MWPEHPSGVDAALEKDFVFQDSRLLHRTHLINTLTRADRSSGNTRSMSAFTRRRLRFHYCAYRVGGYCQITTGLRALLFCNPHTLIKLFLEKLFLFIILAKHFLFSYRCIASYLFVQSHWSSAVNTHHVSGEKCVLNMSTKHKQTWLSWKFDVQALPVFLFAIWNHILTYTVAVFMVFCSNQNVHLLPILSYVFTGSFTEDMPSASVSNCACLRLRGSTNIRECLFQMTTFIEGFYAKCELN